jgi:hypothetical protein
MLKLKILAFVVAVPCLAFVGCGGGSGTTEVIEDVEVQTDEELADYDAEMDAGDPIEE